MITSFVVTLIECLEIAFITLMVFNTSPSKRVYLFGLMGLVLGAVGAKYLYEVIEDYEWLSYSILTLLMLYLFRKGKDVAKHIREHVAEIQTTANVFIVALTVILIYGRESFEIFAQLFLNENASWLAAGSAVIVAVGLFTFARSNKAVTKFIFEFGHWAYLAFAVWFGYEAYEHIEKLL
jgi:ABC-type multidrug transport system fused ATPase/permease subunit